MVPVFFYYMLRQGKHIATINITWNLLSTLYGLFIGIILFQEKVGSLQIYGILLGMISLGLICWEDT